MFFCSLAITKIQLFIEKLLFLPYYFGVGNFSKETNEWVDGIPDDDNEIGNYLDGLLNSINHEQD